MLPFERSDATLFSTMEHARMENNSFKSDFNLPHLNAVVGKWRGSDDYAYVLGFGQAVEVLLSAAVTESYMDPFTEDTEAVYIDALVYPICFCARHFLELFLKRQIRAISALKSGVPEQVETIHDVLLLWGELKKQLAIDIRLQEAGAPLEQYVMDIAAIDISGETFRYRQDKQGNVHLSSLEHINIAVLGRRIKEMTAFAEEFELLMEPLRLEYEQKTTTDGLSREQIRMIAERLPKYETWKNGALDRVKVQLMAELKISSNAFGRAIQIIKAHRGFSSLIGVELPLQGLSPDVFSRLKAIVDGGASATTISDDEWARLEAVLEVGRIYSYCEEYDPLVSQYAAPNRESGLDRGYIQRGVLSRGNRFRVGLQKLGQKTLLDAFTNLFPEEPPTKRESIKEFSTALKGELARMINPSGRE